MPGSRTAFGSLLFYSDLTTTGMRAVVITEPGGPEVLKIEDRPDPETTANQVRVRIRSSSVNRADLLQRRGLYPPPVGYPADIPGLEFAGEVESIGPGAERWKVGDRVMGIIGGGGHAELVCSHEDELLPVPAGWDWPAAGATAEVFLTAFDALFRLAEAETDDRVLIHAVGSGVGTAALQLCRAMGIAACGTSRSPGKLDAARSLGLEFGVNSGGDWIGPVEEWVGDRGINVVLDLVSGPYIAGDLRVLSTGGRIVVVGLVAGTHARIDLGVLLRKRARLIGTVLRSRSAAERAALVHDFEERALPLLENGEVGPILDSAYRFEDIAAAHEYLETNESFGKVALVW